MKSYLQQPVNILDNLRSQTKPHELLRALLSFQLK